MRLNSKITIAIDGYSSCGKSTLAKALAREFKYHYIDTGAMYRAVTFAMLEKDIKPNEISKVNDELKQLKLEFRYSQALELSEMYLNGKNIERQIRDMRINHHVSQYAAVKEIRTAMVAQQKTMGIDGGVVLDGRDIGTVVFPKAELKIFMTASIEVRTQRRFNELKASGREVDKNEVLENLRERDHIDSTRQESPLKKAEDAIVLDNTDLSMSQQLEIAIDWASTAMKQKNKTTSVQ